jgi:hypothetical protein
MDGGAPVLLSPDRVEHCNSRQVHFSQRFIYSTDGRFDLVREMIVLDADERFGRRRGPR